MIRISELSATMLKVILNAFQSELPKYFSVEQLQTRRYECLEDMLSQRAGTIGYVETIESSLKEELGINITFGEQSDWEEFDVLCADLNEALLKLTESRNGK